VNDVVTVSVHQVQVIEGVVVMVLVVVVHLESRRARELTR
jgi:hypothetical protein